MVSRTLDLRKDQILQIEENIQNLSFDLQVLKTRWEGLELKKIEIEKRLSSDDAQKLFEEQQKAIERLDSIPKEIENFNKDLQDKVAKISRYEAQIET